MQISSSTHYVEMHRSTAHFVGAFDMLRGKTSTFKRAVRFLSKDVEVCIVENIAQL